MLEGNDTTKRLAALVAVSDLTHDQIAQAVGVTREAVTQWCSGVRKQPSKSVELAELFGVSLDWLLAGKGPSPDPVAVRAVARSRALSPANAACDPGEAA